MADEKVITLDNIDAFRDTTLQLAQQAQRQIVIFTPDLEPDLYSSDIFIDALLKLIKRSRYTRIRILATETKYLTEQGHKILTPLRRSDEQLQIKKLGSNPASSNTAYFICDDHSIIRRQDANVYRGFCYSNDRARVKDQLEDFDLQWNVALADPNLRQLTL